MTLAEEEKMAMAAAGGGAGANEGDWQKIPDLTE